MLRCVSTARIYKSTCTKSIKIIKEKYQPARNNTPMEPTAQRLSLIPSYYILPPFSLLSLRLTLFLSLGILEFKLQPRDILIHPLDVAFIPEIIIVRT